jgi:hypothetical protein
MKKIKNCEDCPINLKCPCEHMFSHCVWKLYLEEDMSKSSEVFKRREGSSTMKIPKELHHYADWVFIKTGIPQEETIKELLKVAKSS